MFNFLALFLPVYGQGQNIDVSQFTTAQFYGLIVFPLVICGLFFAFVIGGIGWLYWDHYKGTKRLKKMLKNFKAIFKKDTSKLTLKEALVQAFTFALVLSVMAMGIPALIVGIIELGFSAILLSKLLMGFATVFLGIFTVCMILWLITKS